jgi:hypothetical protein
MIDFSGCNELTDAKLVYRPETSWNAVYDGIRVIYRSIALATNDEWAEQAQRMVRAETVRWL